MSGEASLLFKILNAFFIMAKIFVKDLDGDLAIQKGVPSGKDDTHAAFGMFLFEAIGAKEAFDPCLGSAAGAHCSLERGKIGDI